MSGINKRVALHVMKKYLDSNNPNSKPIKVQFFLLLLIVGNEIQRRGLHRLGQGIVSLTTLAQSTRMLLRRLVSTTWKTEQKNLKNRNQRKKKKKSRKRKLIMVKETIMHRANQKQGTNESVPKAYKTRHKIQKKKKKKKKTNKKKKKSTKTSLLLTRSLIDFHSQDIRHLINTNIQIRKKFLK